MGRFLCPLLRPSPPLPKGDLGGMSIFYTILYIRAFSAFRAYEVGVTIKGLPASLFAKASPFIVTTALLSKSRADYIIPPIPPAGICGIGFSAGFSASTHSVVRNIEAIEAAFSRATRDTFVGSIIPAAIRSSKRSSRAL